MLGWKRRARFIIRQILESELETITATGESEFSLADHKSAVAGITASSGRQQPVYVTVKEEGPTIARHSQWKRGSISRDREDANT